MDYVFNDKGIEYVIETNTNESRQGNSYAQRKLLMNYYKKILDIKGIELDLEKENALNYIVDNMTEQNAKIKLEWFEQEEIQRILSYFIAFEKIKMDQESSVITEEPSKEEINKLERIIDSLMEVLNAVVEDDMENNETIIINGNKFIYEKGTINIRDYILKLFDIGEKCKGNTWTIYLDEEGGLVIY